MLQKHDCHSVLYRFCLFQLFFLNLFSSFCTAHENCVVLFMYDAFLLHPGRHEYGCVSYVAYPILMFSGNWNTLWIIFMDGRSEIVEELYAK